MTEQQLEAMAQRVAEIILERLPDKQSTFWLTRQQYAANYKISVRTVDSWVSDGKLETKRLGKRVLVANMAPCQASDSKTIEGGRDGGSGTTGKRSRSQSGLVL